MSRRLVMNGPRHDADLVTLADNAQTFADVAVLRAKSRRQIAQLNATLERLTKLHEEITAHCGHLIRQRPASSAMRKAATYYASFDNQLSAPVTGRRRGEPGADYARRIENHRCAYAVPVVTTPLIGF